MYLACWISIPTITDEWMVDIHSTKLLLLQWGTVWKNTPWNDVQLNSLQLMTLDYWVATQTNQAVLFSWCLPNKHTNIISMCSLIFVIVFDVALCGLLVVSAATGIAAVYGACIIFGVDISALMMSLWLLWKYLQYNLHAPIFIEILFHNLRHQLQSDSHS